MCIVWPHVNDSFSMPFKDVFIKKTWTWILTDMLKTIPVENFQHCYQMWEQRLHRCVAAQGNYFEGDNIDA